MTNTAMSDEERSRKYIQIEVQEFEVKLPTNSSKIEMKLVAGGNLQKSTTLKVRSEDSEHPAAWVIGLDASNLSPSTIVELELYSRSSFRLPTKLFIGRGKSMISDLFNGKAPTVSVSNSATPPSVICTLKTYRINDITEAVGDGVNATNKPQTPPEAAEEVPQFLEVIKTMMDAVSEVHPIAQVAWTILSFGLNASIFSSCQNSSNRLFHRQAYIKQADTDKHVSNLYDTMKSTYEQASNEDVLRKRAVLEGIYNSMFDKTFECCVFIQSYTKKGFFGRLFTRNVSDRTKEFQEAFEVFRKNLGDAIGKDTNIVVRDTRQELKRSDILKKLHPYEHLLPPKGSCMTGTRVETIKSIKSWIEQCSGDMMWCNGLAGTGKSSLAGTLHDDLARSLRAQGQSHLGAFIRYDRTERSSDMPVAGLIPTIAYTLGEIDERIGKAISQVVHSFPHVSSLSPEHQFNMLLREPLKTVQELVNDGPLVVIIDGLDECSNISAEILNVLSRGFGEDLPFMRLIVFSRSIELFTQAFDKKATVYPCHLNTNSRHVIRDVAYFIDIKLEEIFVHLDDEGAFCTYCGEQRAADELAERANGLFVWADVACGLLRDEPCRDTLEDLLRAETSTDALEALSILYSTALAAASGKTTNIRAVLGAIIVARTPPGLKPDDLTALALTPGGLPATAILKKLGAVVHFSDAKEGGFLRLIHKSFDDFLRNPSHCKDSWLIKVEDHERKLAERCLSSLTTFLMSWPPNTNVPTIPPDILNYAVVGPLWHIKQFRNTDVANLRIIFEEHLDKWLEVAVRADKHEDLLDQIDRLPRWVRSLADIDNSFRLIVCHAYQRVEFDLVPRIRLAQPIAARVLCYNILCSDLPLGTMGFSVSADSRTLIGTTDDDVTSYTSWDINETHVLEERPLEPMSSFFNLEESLPAMEDPYYHVLGYLVARQSTVVDYPSVVDPRANWETINRHSDSPLAAQGQPASSLISVRNQASHPQHYLFKGLEDCNLLLYATGIIVIDTQAKVLMRIDMNTADRIWIRVAEEDASQPLRLVDGPLIEVSQDGSTLTQLSCPDREHWVLHRWSTTTGAILSTKNMESDLHRPKSLLLSANGTTSVIIAEDHEDHSYLHIIPSDNSGEPEVIRVKDVYQGSVAFLPGGTKIAYTAEDYHNEDLVIRDVRAKKDIFRHPFPRFQRPWRILVTPDGKTLITAHMQDIRTWCIEAL
ncbi:uncharacterized protein ARMOST_13741 [Armillaria ostoyae]|uniref:Nephrocystin 3-like N-terminal domain-containing protein n=1 Tax=Armillaria ostoyae TaxID=47428 RepID=A0A284RNR6_ARMOS|nr:uncharacterized protein ARMOST_13741 [Armillaria ostoyae]